MGHTPPLTTVVSTKGQVILPKAIRDHRHWGNGTRLMVEETPDGVLLRAAPVFAPTDSAAVYACLPHTSGPKTLDEMDAALLAEARRHRAGD